MTSTPAQSPPTASSGAFERMVLAGVLAVLGLQYYAYDTMNRILAMPSVVVTLPGKLPGAPAPLPRRG